MTIPPRRRARKRESAEKRKGKKKGKKERETIWQTWYYLAHGNRGFIGWVEKWFDGTTPKPWHAEVADRRAQHRQLAGE